MRCSFMLARIVAVVTVVPAETLGMAARLRRACTLTPIAGIGCTLPGGLTTVRSIPPFAVLIMD